LIEQLSEKLEMHGFVTQGFAISTNDDNYFTNRTSQGSARLTEAAVNVSSQLTDRLRVGVQLASIVTDLTPDLNLRVDWAFGDYKINDALGVRLGRVRNGNGLYAEIIDVDAARVAIFLPQTAYQPALRSLLLAVNGIDVYGHLELGAAGAIDYKAWGGATASPPNTPELRTALQGGGRLIYSPIQKLRVGASAMTEQMMKTFTATPTGNIELDFKNFFYWQAFAELTIDDFVFTAEYNHLDFDFRGPDGTLISKTRTEGFYAMATYRLTDWFAMAVYGAGYYADRTKRSSTDPANRQYDGALSFRFDVNQYMILKLEGHYLDGTALVNAALNPDPTKLDTHGLAFITRATFVF